MSLTSFRLFPADAAGVGSPAVIVATTVVVTASLLSLLKRALWPAHAAILPSPLRTLIPRLSREEMESLEYKPDAYPGTRDVETPVRFS
jgi:hypothetical protein